MRSAVAPTRFACIARLAFLFAAGSLSADDLSDLRIEANELFGPLPARMPGGEGDTTARMRLGKKLFFDKRLSADRKISCNTCHDLSGPGGVYKSSDAAVKPMERNSPTVLNAGYHFAQFWDGRVNDLAAQAREPMLNTNEMGMPDEAELLARLRGSWSYPDRFAQAFPEAPEPITLDNIAHALAAYERTLITRDRFDDFLKGRDRALRRAERDGLGLFIAVGCQKCHDGPLLGGNSFKKLGVAHAYQNTNDIGRAKITGDEADRYWFKVPSLRNVALTGPYFHDGKVLTLESAVHEMGVLQLDKELTDAEVRSITAFLRSLSDKKRAMQPAPHRLRSQ